MKRILNLTNHELTGEQLAALKGCEVVELSKEQKAAWGQLTPDNYKSICNEILTDCFLGHVDGIHVAGFQPAVVYVVNKFEGQCFYSYSKRVSKDVLLEDGSVKKVSAFKFEGFYNFD